MNSVLNHFASKKLFSAILAYSILILSGTGLVVFPEFVLAAAATALVTHIGVQGVVDAVRESQQ